MAQRHYKFTLQTSLYRFTQWVLLTLSIYSSESSVVQTAVAMTLNLMMLLLQAHHRVESDEE